MESSLLQIELGSEFLCHRAVRTYTIAAQSARTVCSGARHTSRARVIADSPMERYANGSVFGALQKKVALAEEVAEASNERLCRASSMLEALQQCHAPVVDERGGIPSRAVAEGEDFTTSSFVTR